MRVLHISTSDSGGAGLCCLRIHQALLDIGVDSKVVTLHNTRKVYGEYEYGFFVDFFLSRIPSLLFRIMGLSYTKHNAVRNLSKRYENFYSLPVSSVNLLNCEWVKWADVIHLHWINNYLDYPTFFKKVGKPVVWTLHDENFFYGIAHYSNFVLENHPMEKYYATLKCESIGLIKQLGIVFLSEYMKKKFEGNKLLQGRITCIINNPVDVDLYKPIVRSEARRKIGIADDEVVFAFSAMSICEDRKGLKTLIKAIGNLGNPKIKILAIGNNSEGVVLPNVISVGVKKDAAAMSEALSAANYFAMPSYQEAFAQGPMEAMACGLPVVAFPVSGTSELINDKNGVVCDDFTVDSLQTGIMRIMSKDFDSTDIRKFINDYFSSETIAHKYLNFYREILS